MEAFFFGPSSSQLLGVYHPANPARDQFRAAVLCYPFGQEYMRAHRAFKQLADNLANKGLHVLRFDYRGTGDSAGDLEDTTVTDWLEDIGVAIQEVKDMSAVNKVTLMGLRLGGLLAGIVADQHQSVSGLVVWDPIVETDQYLRTLKQRVAEAPPGKRKSNFIDSNGDLHFNGFCLSSSFQASMTGLSMLELKPQAGPTFQVASHENPDFLRLREAWSGLDDYHYRLVPAAHDWNYVDHVGGILLPQAILQAIVDWI